MSFRQILDAHFPTAVPETDFVKNSYLSLNPHGFSRETTIACVGVCRDEITRSLIDTIHEYWGEAFNFSSLAGMLFLGKTGFLAAHHHAPVENERERYVYYSFPHIAIDKEGNIGVCSRPGRSESSVACGALIAFRNEMLEKNLCLEIDFDDLEQSILKQRLLQKIKGDVIPELIDVTKIAYEVIVEDLERLIDVTVNPSLSDYAVLSGIQIHGPDRKQYIWPGLAYVVVKGQKKEIVLKDI